MNDYFINAQDLGELSDQDLLQLFTEVTAAAERGLLVSPRGEEVQVYTEEGGDNFDLQPTLSNVATMTAQEVESYQTSGGDWDYISAVHWLRSLGQ